MKETLELEQFEVTLLINCLLCLWLFPKERCDVSIPFFQRAQHSAVKNHHFWLT
jgi:hypothetical protein